MSQPILHYQHFLEANPYPRQLRQHSEIMLNVSSNDYLGLSQHPLLIQYSQQYLQKWGAGSGSSRSVTGNLSCYTELEAKIAQGIGQTAALILATGFQTNSTILTALLDAKILGQQPLVFCDRLCHASIYAGIKHLSPLRFRHNDLVHLQQLLDSHSNSKQPLFILAESIYSMEGDQADLAGLIALAKKYQAFLYIDDAHSVGVYGPHGWGLAAAYPGQIDLVMGTFSKGLGSFGAYVACAESVRHYLVNRCQGLIYSTGLPPAVLGAMAAALELLPSLEPQRGYLLQQTHLLRQELQELGLDTGASTTHIIPWIIGDADKAVCASTLLEKAGIIATAIRPPSVPSHKSRLRFCLSALHTEEDRERLVKVLSDIKTQL
ncbi:8-amino-7-oxononanoate synthase [soil metagenome]